MSPVRWVKYTNTIPTLILMDSEKEKKRRAAIAYILRRRKRGRKLGANSGEVVKSVQRKMRGHVVFKPTASSGTWWQQLSWLVAMPLALFIVFVPTVIISAFVDGPHLTPSGLPPHAWIIFALLGIVSVGIIGFATAFTVLSIWRATRRLLGYKNE